MSDERKPMTDEELDAIKGRLAAITEWPWIAFCRSGVRHRMGITNKRLFDDGDAPEVLDVVELGEDTGGIKSEADAVFIANAPTDIARLLAENERLRSEVTRLDKEATRIMDVAICLAEMMDGKHELCPRDCDVLPSAIKCNQYTDFNGEADCDATKCWLHVALNYSANCQHDDEDMGDFHALYEAMLRNEVRKAVEEQNG